MFKKKSATRELIQALIQTHWSAHLFRILCVSLFA